MYILLDQNLQEGIGKKAENLVKLKTEGFNIPNALIFKENLFSFLIEKNKLKEEINFLLKNLNKENIEKTSIKLISFINTLSLDEETKEKLVSFLDNNKTYAVRSSGTKEDLNNFSFAGQYETFLNISGLSEIEQKIIACYSSLFSEKALNYLLDKRIDLDNFSMAIIIQEMVNSSVSGVAFSINPLSGNDKEIIIEVCKGLGENLVSGKVKSETYYYNWFEDTHINQIEKGILSENQVEEISKLVIEIQKFFGYPCDIEFAYENNTLYLLQARPITKIIYGDIKDQWTTANFKDGGVSSKACIPYMWSLYEYVWDFSLKTFLLESKILNKKEIRKLGDMFFGRPYWNLSVVKTAMAKVPGYVERNFDEELGVTINYKGQGQETKFKISLIGHLIMMAFGFNKVKKLQMNSLTSYISLAKEKYDYYLEQLDKIENLENFKTLYLKLVKDDYLVNENKYFRQVFINTIEQTIFKEKMLKIIDKNTYLDLISGIEDISHLRPYKELWEIRELILNQEEEKFYWKNNNLENIVKDFEKNMSKLKSFRKLNLFLETFGYHSDREIDVSYPHFSEDLKSVFSQLIEILNLDENANPSKNREKQNHIYNNALEKLRKKLSERKYKKYLKSIEKMRNMLWWREELKDFSTRFYYLIRLYTLKLGEFYEDSNILIQKNDIFYTKIQDIFKLLDKKENEASLIKNIELNKNYYESFINFKNDKELGQGYIKKHELIKNKQAVLKGVGCNNLIVTSRARVIENPEHMHSLEKGDILVTKFTDTGWTSKFSILSGIITEHGGLLCHAAIISREYGLPCIVAVDNAISHIKDGSIITMNGVTGEIIVN